MATTLFVCSELQRGGAERQWAHLLPALRDRGLEPRLLALRDTGPFYDELAAAGIPVACARMQSRFDLAGLRRAFTAGGRPGLVVSQGTNALVVGEAIATVGRRPHVTIEHAGPGLARRWHRQVLTRAVGHAVDRVVAVSESQRDRLERLGYPGGRLTVIRNGTPRLGPVRPREETRSALGIGPGEFVALLVATLRPEKNVPLFLDAVAASHAESPAVRGLVAGGGPLLEQIRALAGAGGSTTVLGERRDVPDLLVAADVVCLSSDAEALPMVLLEAMSAGRPVVATDVGGAREVVDDGVTGVLVPPNDVRRFAAALTELVADPDRRRRLGDAAKIRHEELFTLDRMADGYQSLLQGELKRAR